MHGLMLAVALAIPFFVTDQLKLKHYDVWMLAPPPPPRPILEVTHYKAPPPPKVERLTPPPVAKPPEVVRPPEPKPLPKPEIANIPKPVPLPRLPEPTPAPAPPPPPKPVQTGVFETSAKPTTNLPARQVQTGGFGDPNGIRGDGRPDKPANIASLGAFDLPAGAGAGNGRGGARGTPGIVASAGFGDAPTAAAKPARTGTAAPGVREGGFGDLSSGGSTGGGTPRAQQRPAAAAETPAEILFKPKPDYTDAARRAKIEGEVLLRVVFTAGGEVRVLDTLSSLGHGLDENAARAARQIRFKPAMRDGRPVDFTAVVHIVFQLAY